MLLSFIVQQVHPGQVQRLQSEGGGLHRRSGLRQFAGPLSQCWHSHRKDVSLSLSASAGIVTLMTCLLQDYVGLRGVFASACAVLTLPVFGLLAFSYVPPLVSTIWLGVTYSFAAVSFPSMNV